jgi:hypothetical protein
VVLVAIAGANDTREVERVAVPGTGEVTLRYTGEYDIAYESTQYFDTGVCGTSRIPTGDGGFRTRRTCDAELLRDAEPRVAPVGGDALEVTEDGGGHHPGGRGETVEVFAVEIDEPGTYEISLDDPPLGTEQVALDPPPEPTPSWMVVPGYLVPILGLAGVILGIVTLVRLALPPRSQTGPGGPAQGPVAA